jgi:hypothetical protein
MVILHVGPDRIPYAAHKEFLRESTNFFRGARDYSFKETDDHHISMSEDDPDTVNRFLQWIYTRSYHLSEAQGAESNYVDLIRLYKLADKLCVDPLKNELLQVLYDLNRRKVVPCFDDLDEAIQLLPIDCAFVGLAAGPLGLE